tara:strand:- start:406 stop:603 length:198 start_codon:yes stop_codon:yes gene_type:complete
MSHSVWIILADGSLLVGWIPASLAKAVLHREPLREKDTFRMVIDPKHGISEDTLLDVRDVLVQMT